MRQEIGYLLLAALVVALGGLIVWLRYNSRDNRYRRQQKRDRDRYQTLMAEKAAEQDHQP